MSEIPISEMRNAAELRRHHAEVSRKLMGPAPQRPPMGPASAPVPLRAAPEEATDAPGSAAPRQIGGRINAEQSRQEVLKQRLGKARRIYEARLRSGWDTYQRAVAAARAGNGSRLVDCLRGRKPWTNGDRDSVSAYIATKVRRRRWPPELERALSETPTEADFNLLADIVEQTGRGPGGVSDEPAHRAARLARVFLSMWSGPIPDEVRTAMIDLACEIEGNENGVVIDPERVRNILDHPEARDRTR